MTIQNSKKIFSTKTMVAVAMMIAMSYVVSLFEFPIFPATPYLKLDFGNVLIMLTGFLFGPIWGIIACAIKESISLIGTSSGGAGQVANMIMTISYILVPSIAYRFRKGIASVITTLGIACILGTIAAAAANRFIVFPLYMKDAAVMVFNSVFWYVIAFNLIKTISISIVTILLYKRLSNVMKKFTKSYPSA